MTWPKVARGVSVRKDSPMFRTRLWTRWLPPMLRLPPFSYLRPGSVAEAAQILAEHGSRARLVAGGTDLLPKMKRGQMEPEILVGPEGEREVPVAALYQDDGKLYLTKADDEVLTTLRLPEPGRWRSSYVKVRSRGGCEP